MSHINSNDEDFFERQPVKPRLRRRSIRETLTVCPKCFSITKMTPGVFIASSYSCTNTSCGWSGTLVIEVDRSDYEDFLRKQKNQ